MKIENSRFLISKRTASFFRDLLIFVLIFAWLFSGWPQIWQNPPIPPEIQEARAATPYIKVQKGEARLDLNVLSTTVNITAVGNQNNAFILLTGRGDDAGGTLDLEKVFATTKFNSNSQIQIERGETAATAPAVANYVWEVIEADANTPTPAFTVQTNEVAFLSTDTQKNVAITNVGDTSKCVVFLQNRNGNGDDIRYVRFRGKLTSTTNLQVNRAASGSTATVRWWVVKFSSDINVYTGSTTMNAVSSTNASIGGTVDLSRSAVFITFDANTNGMAYSMVRSWLGSTSQINFDRGGTTGITNIEWAVVQFPSSVLVQSDNNSSSPNTTGYGVDVTISGITQANTFSVAANKNSGTGTAWPRGITTNYLSSTTNLQLKTGYSGTTNTWTYYVIDTSGWTYTANSVTVSATGSQVSPMAIPSTDNYVGGAFTFISSASTATITSIKISEEGTVNANSNLSNVKLYSQEEATCTFAGSSQLGTTQSFNASDEATFGSLNLSVGTVTQQCVFVVFDVGSGAGAGQTIEIEITASGDVSVTDGSPTGSFPVQISGTTTLQIGLGTVMSTEVDFDWVSGQSSWGQVIWSTTETEGDVVLKVYYDPDNTEGVEDCDTVVPNAALSGNETGFQVSDSPKDISGLNTTTYNRICLKAELTAGASQSPILNDWTVNWPSGAVVSITISNDSVPFGYIALNTTVSNATGTIPLITVDSGPANLNIKSTNFTEGGNTWTLDATGNGVNQIFWEFSKDNLSYSTFASPGTEYFFDINVPTSGTRDIYLRLTTPTDTAYYSQFGATVTVVASAP